MIGETSTIKPVSTKAVDVQISQLREVVGHLHMQIGNLASQLSRVSRLPEGAPNTSATGNAISTVPLASELLDIRDIAESCSDQIAFLLTHLEI